MDAVTPGQDRLRALLEAGVAITSELSLDALLQRVVETAADLIGARYAALGVIDRSGSQLERFMTTGIDPEAHATIGDLPRGRGILGVLIREARPLRLHDLREDPRSVGFPPGHPPMHSFLGVPILLRGVAYGNFYLTEKANGEDFTEEDEELVTLLAAQAAVAIENARLYEAAMDWSKQLESLNEVGNALATETDLDRLLDLVARRLRELLGARVVTVLLPTGVDELRFAAVAGEGAEGLLGETVTRSRCRRAAGCSSADTASVSTRCSTIPRSTATSRGGSPRGPGLWVPLVARGRAIGVIQAPRQARARRALLRPRPPPRRDLRLARRGRGRPLGADRARRPAPRGRRAGARAPPPRPRAARRDRPGADVDPARSEGPRGPRRRGQSRADAVGRLRELVVATLQDVRRLAVELRPKVLDDFGLVPALERLTETFAERTGIDVQFKAALAGDRLPPEVETALYRIVQESLTNVVKHARAGRVSVLLTRKNGAVVAVVEDDGQGFDPDSVREGGFGLEGMRERVGLLDGRLQIEARPGAGTTLVIEVPLR